MKTKKPSKERIASLKKVFEFVAEQYIEAFVNKQGYEFDGWVSDDVGGVAVFIEQYYFSFDDIRMDIDREAKKGLIFQWQDEGIENPKLKINYDSYIMGLRYEDLKKYQKEKKKNRKKWDFKND